MLTVKHVVDGRENIYLAPYGATYVGPHSLTGIGGSHIEIPQAAEDDPRFGIPVKCLHRGCAYIMNESGRTVGAYYDLGEPPQPPAAA